MAIGILKAFAFFGYIRLPFRTTYARYINGPLSSLLLAFAIVLTSFRRGFIYNGLSLLIYNHFMNEHKGGAGRLSKTWRRSLSRGSISPPEYVKELRRFDKKNIPQCEYGVNSFTEKVIHNLLTRIWLNNYIQYYIEMIDATIWYIYNYIVILISEDFFNNLRKMGISG